MYFSVWKLKQKKQKTKYNNYDSHYGNGNFRNGYFMSTRNSSKLLSEVVAEIESDKEKFIGQDIEAFLIECDMNLLIKKLVNFQKMVSAF